MFNRLKHTIRTRAGAPLKKVAGAAIDRLPPRWLGYRKIRTESLEAYVRRYGRRDSRVTVAIPHPEEDVRNPLPSNVSDRRSLPNDAGWWGYSFWDVPERHSAPTVVARLRGCRIVPFVDDRARFWVTVLTHDYRSLEIREMALRPWHRETLLSGKTVRFERAVWALERVFDNYSHWLTAHLPKFMLLREMGLDRDILLPEKRPSFIDESLRFFGFDLDAFRTFPTDAVVEVDDLTVIDTDRFRPQLLQRHRSECPNPPKARPTRRVFISRKGATRRRLVNEDEIWPLLEDVGFERVKMEELNFSDQVKLMQETAALCAPHGAGLTNMVYCQAGAHVIELADLSFPNPNFYAVACAMNLNYWLVPAEALGDVHPLEKDLQADPERVAAVLRQLDQEVPLVS